jgi:hypothetical protein
MDESTYGTKGLLIPAAWLRRLGATVSIQRSGAVIIIESTERRAARERLKASVRRIRGVVQRRGGLPPGEIAKEIAAVRTRRARRR